MNERLIDHFLLNQGYTSDEIEDMKMCYAEDSHDNMVDDEMMEAE